MTILAAVPLYLASCYLIGNIMTGFIVAKMLKGVDLRKEGSGNIGARNAGRVLGNAGFVLTLGGDAAKGALAVWGAELLGLGTTYQLLGLLAVLVGHCWPIVLKFHGGKGVAAFIGGILVIDYQAALIMAAVFLLLFGIKRSLTAAGLVSFALYPVIYYFLGGDLAHALLLVPSSVLVVWVQKEELKERMLL
ncbi:glycerol-3-phosphate acyltransferase [Fictibacillus iocasae]|uniref:Glycerol-3-phosphate acyltransferase n=1 Tax=Fictibacillus iocasae TaxID=2715437 RepID=A0ABW2NMS0_9BACL